MQTKSKNPLTNLKEFDGDLKEILNQKKNALTAFSLEITLTEGCNWNCEYCFEGNIKKTEKKDKLTENPQVLLDTIDKILESEWFKSKFDFMNIDFWGGEPTLNLPLMKLVLEHYQDNERVSFFLYTNGSRVKELLPLVLSLKDKPSLSKDKMLIQISYDGNPIHDIRRLDKKGNSTSAGTREAMDLLYNNQVLFQLKSTLMPKDFKHMSQAWDDMNKLKQKYGNLVNYAPTIDYFTVEYNDEHYSDLEKSLLEIAQKEIKTNKELDKFTFSWFGNDNKSVCGSGKYMCAIDINGNVHFCHGCIYGNKLRFANIYTDDKIFEGIKKNNEMLQGNSYDIECEKCEATTCLRCNYLKYLSSNKKNFIDKFYDFRSQPELCRYYKLVGKIDRAVREVLRRK